MPLLATVQKPISLKEYAESRGITYFSAWRIYKKGYLKCKFNDNKIVVNGINHEPRRPGRPSWKYGDTEESVLKALFNYCKGRYVKAKELPSYLYKKCRKMFGSVRAAKWKAKLIHGQFSKSKFIKFVQQFCKTKYREDVDWDLRSRKLAKQWFGSIRAAKWAAGVIYDKRHRKRKIRVDGAHLSKGEFIDWVSLFCKDGYKKAGQWPVGKINMAVSLFGSVRNAKRAAKIIPEVRHR